MNTRPILDSNAGPFALSASFNAGVSCFSVALESGFRIFDAKTGDQKIAREVGGGIGCAEMITTTPMIALVGGGKQPKFPQNKVQIWNDAKKVISTSLEFKMPVYRVRISQTHLIVVLLNKVGIYKMALPPKKIADYETVNNPHGLCEMTKNIVAFPGRVDGQVKIFNFDSGNVSIIPAHETSLRSLALSNNSNMVATASEKGTLIRIWSYPSCTKLAELRRGVDTAAIFSLAFSPSGSTLAVTSDKSTVHIFDLPDGTTLGPDPKQHKWGILSKVPLLPRQFSDTYPTASARFEMGDELVVLGSHSGSGTYVTGIPGVPDGRPTKGLLGWLDDQTLLVIGAGQDARWEKFLVGVDDSGRRGLVRDGWRRYLD